MGPGELGRGRERRKTGKDIEKEERERWGRERRETVLLIASGPGLYLAGSCS